MNHQKKIVIYSIPKHSAIAFIENRKVNYDFDKALFDDQGAMLFHVRHHWWACGVNEEMEIKETPLPMNFGKLILFEGLKILVIDSSVGRSVPILKNKLKIDLLILSHSPKVSLAEIGNTFDCKELVFDSSNNIWKTEKWKLDCARLNLSYWDVNTAGCYTKDLNR